MATRASTTIPFPIDNFIGGARGGSWSGLLNGDDGAPLSLPAFSDRSVQILGTFGAGGTVVIEGSLDGTNWVTLTNPLGTALSFTAAGLRSVTEGTPYIRPRVTAGDGTTNLTVVFFGISKTGS